MRKTSIIPAILLTVVFFSILLIIFGTSMKINLPIPVNIGKVTVSTDKSKYKIGEKVSLSVTNKTSNEIELVSDKFLHLENGTWRVLSATNADRCLEKLFFLKPAAITLQPFKSFTVSDRWNQTEVITRCKNEPDMTLEETADLVNKYSNHINYIFQMPKGSYKVMVKYKFVNSEDLKTAYSKEFKIVD